MTLSRFAGLSLALAATTLSFGCTSSEQATQTANAESSTECPWKADDTVTGKVRVGFQILPVGDLVVKDQKILEACLPKAEIEWTQYASGGDVVQAFGSDSVDIGTVGSSPSVKAVSAPLDLDVRVVWVQDVIGEAEALVAKDPSVATVADLKGATIGVPFSSTAHFSLLAALDAAGLDPARDVKIINLAPEAIIGAWKGDQIDAAYIWDPTLGELVSEGKKLLSGKEVAEMGSPTFDLSVASVAFLEESPGFLETWTRAQDWAVKLIQEDPSLAAESLAVEMGADISVVETQLAGTTYLTAKEQLDSYFGGQLGQVMADTAAFLAEQGEIDAPADVAHYTAAVHSDALVSTTE